MKPLSHFAKAVSTHLKHTGETQIALSKRSGISKTSLHDFLAGKRDLNFEGVVALISCLDYNARWMLTGHKSKAMLEHKASLDAAKNPKARVQPSDELVIARLKEFAYLNGIEIKQIPEDNRWATFFCNADFYSRYGLEHTIKRGTCKNQGLIDLAANMSSQNIQKNSEIDIIIRAPNFFA